MRPCRAGCHRDRCRRSGASHYAGPMAIVREERPWAEVLNGEQLVTTSRLGARAPELVPLPDDLHPAVLEALRQSGVDQLYSHQAEAWSAAREGHTIVTTGTASGKSLAFNLPVLDTLATDARA